MFVGMYSPNVNSIIFLNYFPSDAKQMAKDVQQVLTNIVIKCGKRTAKEAEQYIVALQNSNRYQTDVWF
jgi:sulfite reductase (NADPH) flavoprotein alpha-component